jgi:hypothetical protein
MLRLAARSGARNSHETHNVPYNIEGEHACREIRSLTFGNS